MATSPLQKPLKATKSYKAMKPIPDQILLTKEDSAWIIRLIFNNKREPVSLAVSDPSSIPGIIKNVLKGSYA
jgi:hypothetical protein